MPDPRVEGAVKNLVYRFVAHGVEYADWVKVTAPLEDWSQWLDAWVAAAERYETLAAESRALGRIRTAAECHFRAAVYHHVGKHAWLDDLAKYRAACDRSVAELLRAMPVLDHTFERLEIPFERDRIVANLRRPPGLERAPVVILVPGLDSTKEELPAWEEAVLRRGMASVSLDGPGQGEAGYVNPLRPDYEVPVAALLDVLERRTDLDLSRVGISGLGMGGYYASRTAAFEPRIAAAGVVGGPYQFPRMPPLVQAKFMHSAHLTDFEEARALAERFTLDGVITRIKQPYLVVHGQFDAVMPWQEAEERARQAPRGEFRLEPEGNTVCHTVSHTLRPFIADWLREKIGA